MTRLILAALLGWLLGIASRRTRVVWVLPAADDVELVPMAADPVAAWRLN